jgi:hypothetical protein
VDTVLSGTGASACIAAQFLAARPAIADIEFFTDCRSFPLRVDSASHLTPMYDNVLIFYHTSDSQRFLQLQDIKQGHVKVQSKYSGGMSLEEPCEISGDPSRRSAVPAQPRIPVV